MGAKRHNGDLHWEGEELLLLRWQQDLRRAKFLFDSFSRQTQIADGISLYATDCRNKSKVARKYRIQHVQDWRKSLVTALGESQS